jgi:AcrR family transcriptional regulator
MRTSEHVRQDGAAPKVRRQSLQVRKQQVVREAIWDAAIDLFSQKGFDETTIEDIVEAAGVSRRSFFRYFSSKSDLMSQRTVVKFETVLADAMKTCPASYPLSELLKYTVQQLSRDAANPRTRKIMEIAAKSPAAREALSRIAGEQEIIAAAFASRCGKGNKARIAANLLAGLTLVIEGAIVHAWCENPTPSIDSISEQVFAIVKTLTCESAPVARER